MDEKATQLHAIASLKVLLDATRPQNGSASAMSNHAGHHSMRRPSITEAVVLESGCEAAAAAMSRTHQETELVSGAPDQPNGVLGQEEGADPVSHVTSWTTAGTQSYLASRLI